MFKDVFEKVYDEFKRDYGIVKFDKIYKKITNSKHTKSLISQTLTLEIAPYPKDLRQCVLSNLSLAFSNKATEKVAMTIILEIWHVNVNMKFYLLDKSDLQDLIGRFDDVFTY